MSDKALQRVREDMQEMITRAQEQYDRAIEEILSEAETLARSFRPTIGELSPEQALTAWKRELATRLTV